MKNEYINLIIKSTGILLCFITIIILIDYRGLTFWQGFILKTTLTVSSGIFLNDILNLDIIKKLFKKDENKY